MNDLNQIIRNNSKASQDSITSLVANGKFVVAIYDGLNYINHEAFGSASAADDYIAERTSEGHRGETLKSIYPETQAA